MKAFVGEMLRLATSGCTKKLLSRVTSSLHLSFCPNRDSEVSGAFIWAMRRRRIKGDTWADVYREGTFSGRIYRLGPGERTRINNVGSIIVGPKAVVRVMTLAGRELLTLHAGMVVEDVAELAVANSDSYLRVSRRLRTPLPRM